MFWRPRQTFYYYCIEKEAIALHLFEYQAYSKIIQIFDSFFFNLLQLKVLNNLMKLIWCFCCKFCFALLLSALLRGCSYGGALARLSGLARLVRWFLSRVHMGSSISVQSKSLLCRWKKIIWSSIFYNKVT